MNLPKFALEHKRVVLVASLIPVALGLLVYMTTPREDDPQLTIRDGFIVTPWPGATAAEVEQLVTGPPSGVGSPILSDQLRQAAKMLYVASGEATDPHEEVGVAR